jgi:hypothetical protein
MLLSQVVSETTVHAFVKASTRSITKGRTLKPTDHPKLIAIVIQAPVDHPGRWLIAVSIVETNMNARLPFEE